MKTLLALAAVLLGTALCLTAQDHWAFAWGMLLLVGGLGAGFILTNPSPSQIPQVDLDRHRARDRSRNRY